VSGYTTLSLQQVTGPEVITAPSATTVPLTIKAAPSQSANLTEWQDSSGAVKAFINSVGNLRVANFISDLAATGPYLDLGATSLQVNARTNTNVGFVVKGASAQAANLQEWQDNANAIRLAVDAAGTLGNPNGATTIKLASAQNFRVWAGSAGSVVHLSTSGNADTGLVQVGRSTSGPTLLAQGVSGLTGDIQQWQDSTTAVLASIDSIGTLQGRYLELSGAGTPGVTALAAAGTGATASMVAGSTDTRGTINLTTGTGATGGDQLTFTFATARPSAVYYVLTSFAGNFQGATFTAKGKSTTAFTLASSGLTASTAYQIDYLVIL
jgi:hypothetical protein